MTTPQLSWIFLAVCTAATVLAGFSANRIPVVASVTVAGVLHIAFAALTSRNYTPRDVAVYFRTTGEMLLAGNDPVHDMPGRQWNFLELMPAVHALELRSGLPWVYAVKIAPILADLALVALVARLAVSDGRTRALQYAVNPVSLLIAGLHGQVEPVALALALSGIVLLKKNRPVLAGLLLGAAIAAKTWPVVILLAVLPLRNLPRLTRIVAGAAVVPVGCLVLGVLFLDTQPLPDLRHMASYSSFVYYWTWSATLISTGAKGMSGYTSSLGPLATVFIVIGIAVVLWTLRRRPPEVRALGVLCAILLCTAGFGPQYLMWVLPLASALAGSIRTWYVVAASGWAALFYLHPLLPTAFTYTLRGLSWLPAAVLLAVLLELVRGRDDPGRHAVGDRTDADDAAAADPSSLPAESVRLSTANRRDS
jgi:hypothetical protein